MIPNWKRKKLETDERLRQITQSYNRPEPPTSETPMPMRRFTQADVDHAIAERKAGLRR